MLRTRTPRKKCAHMCWGCYAQVRFHRSCDNFVLLCTAKKSVFPCAHNSNEYDLLVWYIQQCRFNHITRVPRHIPDGPEIYWKFSQLLFNMNGYDIRGQSGIRHCGPVSLLCTIRTQLTITPLPNQPLYTIKHYTGAVCVNHSAEEVANSVWIRRCRTRSLLTRVAVPWVVEESSRYIMIHHYQTHPSRLFITCRQRPHHIKHTGVSRTLPSRSTLTYVRTVSCHQSPGRVLLSPAIASRGGSSTLRGMYQIMPRHIIRKPQNIGNPQISANPYRTTAYHELY